MSKKILYIVTKDGDLLERKIDSEDEETITVDSRYYENLLITYDKSQSVFKSKKEALKYQNQQNKILTNNNYEHSI